MLFLLLAVIAHQCINDVSTHKLPDNYPRCKQDDSKLNECLLEAAVTVVPLLKEGIPSLGVAPMDPLKVTSLEIGEGQGPIAINLKFSDVLVKGLSDVKITQTNIELKKYSMRFGGYVQKVSMEGDYEMSGRILLLPVTGKGRCKLTFTNVKANYNITGKGTLKKNINYFDILDSSLNGDSIDKLESRFDNLFNGDKALGDTMNALLNDNWKDLWDVLKPSFTQVLNAIFLQYSKNIFSKVSFNDIFLE